MPPLADRTNVWVEAVGLVDCFLKLLTHGVYSECSKNRRGYKSLTGGKSEGGMMSTVAERCWASIPPSTFRTSPVT